MCLCMYVCNDPFMQKLLDSQAGDLRSKVHDGLDYGVGGLNLLRCQMGQPRGPNL